MSTSHEIYAALRRRYSPPEWAIFAEVITETGRRADAVAMNLWPSRGLKIVGCEIKIARNDWLREKKNPAKAEAMAALCNEWWLVTTENVIRSAAEIPETWGWLVFKGKTLRIQRQPTPSPSLTVNGDLVLGRPLVASLLRRAFEAAGSAPELAAARSGGYEDGFAAGTSRTRAAGRLAELEAKLRALEHELDLHRKAQKAAGLGDYQHWDLANLGRHVALLHSVPPTTIEQTYKRSLRDVDEIVRQFNSVSADLRQALAQLLEVKNGDPPP